MGATGICGSWITVCCCQAHGWMTRLVCDLPKYHKGSHRRGGEEWNDRA